MSLAQLNATTATNPTTVSPLSMIVSDPPIQAEVQLIANKVDELLAALKRRACRAAR